MLLWKSDRRAPKTGCFAAEAAGSAEMANAGLVAEGHRKGSSRVGMGLPQADAAFPVMVNVYPDPG